MITNFDIPINTETNEMPSTCQAPPRGQRFFSVDLMPPVQSRSPREKATVLGSGVKLRTRPRATPRRLPASPGDGWHESTRGGAEVMSLHEAIDRRFGTRRCRARCVARHGAGPKETGTLVLVWCVAFGGMVLGGGVPCGWGFH